jgi:hypothetical protein
LQEIKRLKGELVKNLNSETESVIQRHCRTFYQQTGCTVSEIKIPIRTEYVLGQKTPSHLIVMPFEIELNEL